MSDRSEWEGAAEELIARERERLGGPPTPEKIAAYVRGELPEDEAARVRALLVAHPEAAEALTRDAVDNAPLSDEELAHEWASIQKRIASETMPVVEPLRPLFLWRIVSLAAMIAVAALGGLLVHSRLTVRRITNERDQPRIQMRHELLPADTSRGPNAPAPYPLPPEEDGYLLALLLYDNVEGALDITDTRTKRTIWTGRVTSPRNRTVELTVPRAFLDPGTTYRLDFHPTGSTTTPVASYFVRVR